MPKYGYVSGPRTQISKLVGNTGAISDGDCLVRDAGYNQGVMRATDGDIPSFVASQSASAPTTDGDTSILVDINQASEYRLPVVTGTLAVTMEGEMCDIGVAGTVIGLDVNATTDDCVRINKVEVAGAVGVGYALCTIYFHKNADTI